MDRLRLDDLARFVQVARSGGFSAAARVLGESPKVTSRRIAELEATLGKRLLHRTTRQVSLTPEGERYLLVATEVVQRLEEAHEALDDDGPISGRLRVKVFTMMSAPFMQWLAGILDEHPELRVDVEVSDHLDDLVSSGLDLAFTAHPPRSNTVLVRRLGVARARLLAHESYLARHGMPQTPEDLAQHRCLRFDSQTHWTLEHAELGLREVPVDRQLSTNDSRSLQDALTAGLGIGVGIRPRAGLVQVLPEWSWQPTPIYVLIAPGRRQLKRVRLVLDSLDELGELVFPGLMQRS